MKFFPKLICSFGETLRFEKNGKANALIFADFLVFFLLYPVFPVRSFWNFYPGRRALKPTFLKISGNSVGNSDSDWASPVFPFFDSCSARNRDPTLKFTPYHLRNSCNLGKKNLKKFPVVPETWQFLAQETGFLALGPAKRIHCSRRFCETK